MSSIEEEGSSSTTLSIAFEVWSAYLVAHWTLLWNHKHVDRRTSIVTTTEHPMGLWWENFLMARSPYYRYVWQMHYGMNIWVRKRGVHPLSDCSKWKDPKISSCILQGWLEASLEFHEQDNYSRAFSWITSHGAGKFEAMFSNSYCKTGTPKTRKETVSNLYLDNAELGDLLISVPCWILLYCCPILNIGECVSWLGHGRSQ